MKPFRLSRRALLKAGSVALALPALEAMGPVKAATAQAQARLRFVCFFTPNGYLQTKWKPTGTGANYTLSPLLMELAAFKSDFNVITGLGNYTASLTNIFGGSHTRGTGSLLTQCPIASPDTTSDIRNGISLDQIIAGQIGDQTRFPSIQVGTRASSLTGNCEDSFSCAYNNNISWSGPTTPVTKQVDPRDVFNRLFTNLPDASAATDNTALYQKSILDVVLDRANALASRLGKTDRDKLDEYFTSVREVEQRLARTVDGTSAGGACSPGEPPDSTQGGGMPFTEHLDLMSDLIVLAFQCDVTRVATFMTEHPFSDARSFDFLPGVTGRHHEITHSDSADQEESINRFYLQRFAYLIGKMKAVVEGDATMLDNSIVYLTSEFSNAHTHNHRDMTMVQVGKAGGRFKTGQRIDYPLDAAPGQGVDGLGNRNDKQLAHLHLTVLHAFDIPQTGYGHDENGDPVATTTLSEIVV